MHVYALRTHHIIFYTEMQTCMQIAHAYIHIHTYTYIHKYMFQGGNDYWISSLLLALTLAPFLCHGLILLSIDSRLGVEGRVRRGSLRWFKKRGRESEGRDILGT